MDDGCRGAQHAVMTDPPILLTARELAGHERELARLRAVRDRELPELLRGARTYVAADANEENVQLLEDRVVLTTRIARLEEILRCATVIDDGAAAGIATLGTAVTVEDVDSGRGGTYRLVGAHDARDARQLSARSPVGRAVMGRRVGDVVHVELPGGQVTRLRLVSIDAARAEPG
jgi:transcription elongation factor GreA